MAANTNVASSRQMFRQHKINRNQDVAATTADSEIDDISGRRDYHNAKVNVYICLHMFHFIRFR